MTKRTNEEWVWALQQTGAIRREALSTLRDYLFRAVFVYLRDHRTDLLDVSESDLRSMAEDFAQEAVLAIQDNLHTFRGDSKFTTWAYRFVINQAAMTLRRRDYRDTISWEKLTERETAVFKSLLQSRSGLDPDLAAERRNLLVILRQIIDTELNERQRIALVGIHLEGRSTQEIADQLDTSPNTVYKMLYDARQKIKAKLLAQHLGAGDILALFEIWL